MTSSQITVRGIPVQIDHKPIKNLHVSVYPPDGKVRLAVPLKTTDDAARLAVVSRLGWIKRHQKNFQEQPRQSEREMVNGESHYVFGRRYLLEVIERYGRHELEIGPSDKLKLYVRPGTGTDGRKRALHRWHRELLAARIPDLLAKWEPKLGVQVADWGVRRMKTKWGSCSIEARRIWLNSELAKAPEECLEYVVVHEMVHLLERNHTERFRQILADQVPQWLTLREILSHIQLEGKYGDSVRQT